LTANGATGDGGEVLNLQALVRTRMDERGWGYADLARRSGDRLTRGRWQQLGTGVRLNNFPEPGNLAAMADALEVDVTTVILATARSLGLPAHRRGPDFAHLLPAGIDQLPEGLQLALLTMIRAIVADKLASSSSHPDEDPQVGESTFRWPKTDSPTRRNSVGSPGRADDTTA
jgi:hypothetical protein